MNPSANILRTNARRGFSLIELLVVIGIILVLTTISVVVGNRVIDSRKAATTQQIITGLDGVLETYIQERSGSVPAYNPAALLDLWASIPDSEPTSIVERIRHRYGDKQVDGVPTFENDITPVTDTPNPATGEVDFIRPSSAMFAAQVRGVAGVNEAFGRFPSSRLVPFPGDTGMVAVLDAWSDSVTPDRGHILYVHPSNQRAQQLYGYCQNGRPYFLSAGGDGIYGSIHDIESRADRDRVRNRRRPFQTSEEIVAFFQKARADNVTSYEVRPSPIGPDADLQINPEQ